MTDGRITPDPEVRSQNGGRILLGGSPTTILRLSEAGAGKVSEWFAGAPPGTSETESRLVERLLATGIAHPVPPKSSVSFSVIIPVRHDDTGLKATLGSLGNDETFEVIVVEDSADQAMGPAAARNNGAKTCSADVLVFVDAGVKTTPETLRALVDFVADASGNCVAVAPRILATPTEGPIGKYEADHSPLDLGPLPGSAAPGRRISYLPSTVLAVRRDVFEEVAGFDESLRFGEDVDLVWRLLEHGKVRYVPHLTASHPPRQTLTAFVKQRFNYGSSAGPLARRHGDFVAPVAITGWSVVTILLAAFPLPKTLLLWLAGLSYGLKSKMPGPTPGALALDTTLRGNFAAVESVATATTRTWWPFAVLGLASPLRSRILVGFLWSWSKHRSTLGLLDDVAYGAGVWRGTLRAATARSVLPRINFRVSQSKRSNN